MPTVLGILCGLMILFAGGCAIVLLGAGALPIAAIPAAIVAANVLVILALQGKRKPSFGAFAALACLDLVIGVPMLSVILADPRTLFDDDFQGGMLLLAVALVAKGILTIMAASRLRKQGASTGGDENARPENSWDGPP
jgi:hypothetical protein